STLDKTILEDIICDICQKSCRPEHRHEDYEEGDELELKESDFEFLEIKGSFGYYSKRHDTEAWEAQICEDCSEHHLEKIICFTKHDYMTNSASNSSTQYQKYKDDVHEELNKRGSRIRKVRKLLGDVEFEIVPKKKD
ncbi:MAG: hypothetical protein RLZZ546_2310, partial [Bacteroidota bacterium]